MATTSRYAPVQGGSNSTNPITDSRVSSNGSTSGTQATNGTQSTSGNTYSNTATNSTTRNLDSGTQALLNQLIAQLMSGGTPAQRAQQAQRNGEISTVQNERAGYTRESAFTDAAGLISQQMRRSLEASLPGINRAAEDAGSSGGALRALLLQDASNKAAESSSALGVQTAAQYGNINANFSQILERLTQSDPTVMNGLIAAMNVAKGAVTTTNGTSSTSSQTDQTTQTQQQQSTSGNENKNINTDYAPFAVTNTPSNKSGGPQLYYGPSDPSAGLSNDLLSALSTNRAFSEFQF